MSEVIHVKLLQGGQIKLPPKVLRHLGVSPGDELELKLRDKEVTLSTMRAATISDELRGSLKTEKDKIREILELEIYSYNSKF